MIALWLRGASHKDVVVAIMAEKGQSSGYHHLPEVGGDTTINVVGVKLI